MSPELISGFVQDLLSSQVVPAQAGDKVIDDLARYIPDDDAAALTAAAHHALRRGRPLPIDQMRRVAAASHEIHLTMRLLTDATPTPPGPEIVAVVAALGEPYSHLSDRTQHEFEVPADEEHRAVLDHLKEARVISEFKKRRMRDLFVVKLV